MFKLFEAVRLREDDTKNGITTDQIGTIVDIQNSGEAYTVEFTDRTKDGLDAMTLDDYRPEQLAGVIDGDAK